MVDLHLQTVVKSRGAAACLHDVASIEVPGDPGIARLPNAGLKLAGLVTQDEVQVGLVGLRGSLLFEQNQKEAVKELAFFKSGQIGDIDVFHAAQ